jgi:ankyrin repeat protein
MQRNISALAYAIESGSIEIARLLIDSGFDVNSQDIVRIFIFSAFQHADSWFVAAQDGTTALMTAVLGRDIDTSTLLLERGADVNIADEVNKQRVYKPTNDSGVRVIRPHSLY